MSIPMSQFIIPCPRFSIDSEVKNPLAIQETRQQPQVDPWVRKIPWSRKWQPTPVLLPGKSHGRGAWWPTVHGVAKELDTT